MTKIYEGRETMHNPDYRAIMEDRFFTFKLAGINTGKKEGVNTWENVYCANELYKLGVSAARQPRKKSVLVVDGNEKEREFLLDNLMHKYKVIGAASGIDALETFKNNCYDLVISEIRLPEMTGIDLLKTIKSIRPQVKVIIVTAYGEVKTYLEAICTGAFDYITKPIKVPHLHRIINKAVSN
jgi:CheY-like chemotaxis protein